MPHHLQCHCFSNAACSEMPHRAQLLQAMKIVELKNRTLPKSQQVADKNNRTQRHIKTTAQKKKTTAPRCAALHLSQDTANKISDPILADENSYIQSKHTSSTPLKIGCTPTNAQVTKKTVEYYSPLRQTLYKATAKKTKTKKHNKKMPMAQRIIKNR